MSIIFEDIFTIKDIDPECQKFEDVSRLHCDSESSGTDLILDISSKIYPMNCDEKFHLALAKTSGEDGSPEADYWSGELEEINRIAEEYDYVMRGKVYKVEDNSEDKFSIYISYGGLLMRLQGEVRGFELDEIIYLLVKKYGNGGSKKFTH